MFNLNLLETPDLECVTSEQGRYYVAPDGRRLNSVTTVLGRQKKSQGLIDWRNRIGDIEADGIMRQASIRGTAAHDLLEQYLRNIPDCIKNYNSLTRQRFRELKPLLDKNISEIFGLELPLYSYDLMAAGRMDMACIWDGIPSIVDFKTANRLKTSDFIENYFIQAAAYAYMLQQLTGLNTLRLVILIMVEHESPQMFIEDRSVWEPRMLKVFQSKNID
jgi:hypothetical protein